MSASRQLEANFVKINLRHAISVLVLVTRTGTFLFPKSSLHERFLQLAGVTEFTEFTDASMPSQTILA